jgi:uncharacterized protein YbjQ (UPF0145 family)
MIVVSIETVPGREVVEVLGLVRGNAVRARGLVFDITAAIRNLLGGRIPEYAELITQSRDEATAAMVAEAEALGADAIVTIRYSTSMIGGGFAEILAYGTAVKLR